VLQPPSAFQQHHGRRPGGTCQEHLKRHRAGGRHMRHVAHPNRRRFPFLQWVPQIPGPGG
jgi:hypothetical protein